MSDPQPPELSMRSTKAELLAAYRLAAHRAKPRPFERLELARLVACGSQYDLAGWVIDQMVAVASCGDEHAREVIAALHLKMSAESMAGKAGAQS